MTKQTALQTIEQLRTINCLNYNELKSIFHDYTDTVIRRKERKGLNFLFDLDSDNLALIFDAAQTKIDANKPEYFDVISFDEVEG